MARLVVLVARYYYFPSHAPAVIRSFNDDGGAPHSLSYHIDGASVAYRFHRQVAELEWNEGHRLDDASGRLLSAPLIKSEQSVFCWTARSRFRSLRA